MHSLEQAAAGIGLHANAQKIEYMCFNQTGDIYTLGAGSLKLVDKFTYLGSSASSTEADMPLVDSLFTHIAYIHIIKPNFILESVYDF